MTTLLVIFAIIGILVALIISIYNRLVKNRNLVQEGWSGIDVQLKRRADLIPNLIETVKGYMGHERGVLEKVTEMRTRSLEAKDIGEKGKAEGLLAGALGHLFAVAENYPDLKANQNFIELQGSLSEIEEQIQLSRRYYNGAVRNFNILIESFPSNMVANFFGFKQAEYFEITTEADRAVPKVSF